MSKKIRAIPGTKDILPDDMPAWYRVEEVSKAVFNRYNFREIRTPMFESTSLFARGIGEETDIVSKEMYTFLDKGEDSLTLRPEMTAPVVRSFVEHSMHSISQINKLFYFGPMFRQERPQAGRQRQFHQFGAEILGSASPYSDCEIILAAAEILKNIGLTQITVNINSLGKPETRELFKEKLRAHLKDQLHKLSPESQKRYHTNILRIFDSKEQQDNIIMKTAPVLYDFLDAESREEFDLVQQVLTSQNLKYEFNYQLVRGLDYYTKTTFEIVSHKVGAQSALCGGGRYDNLVEQLGGPSIPGVGFAAGVERILLAAKNEGVIFEDNLHPTVYVVNLQKENISESFFITQKIRSAGYSVEMDIVGRSVKAQMREANKLKAALVVILGGDEAQEGNCTLKNMGTGEQNIIAVSEITGAIGRSFNG